MSRTKHNLIGISGRIGSGKDTFAKLLRLAMSDMPDSHKRLAMPSIATKSFDTMFGTSDRYSWKVKKFADKLKEMVCLLTGCEREDLEDPAFKNRYINGWAITYRELLQQLGTKVREINPKGWIYGLFADYEHPIFNPHTFALLDQSTRGLDEVPDEDYPMHSKWLITDMRYPDELEMIQGLGGIVIRISAGGHPGSDGTSLRNVWTPDGLMEMDDQPINLHSSETALDHFKLWDAYIKNTGSLLDMLEQAKEVVTKFNLQL